MAVPPAAEAERLAALARAVHAACVRAIIDGREEAGLAGLCGDGRWELALDRLRTLNLEPLVRAALTPTPPAAGER